MKRRRTVIISFLLVAALALGIGYAGFAAEMIVNGRADINATPSAVVFSAATRAEGTSTDVTVSPTGLNTASLTLNVTGFAKAGDKAVVDVTISNPHDFPVTISDYTGIQGIDLKNAADEFYFTATASDAIANDKVIAAEGSLTFKVTLLCNASSASVVNENFTISFKANAA